MLESIASFFNIYPETDDFEKYKAAVKEDNGTQTAYFTETNGAVMANENIGIIFRKNPHEFAKNLEMMSENCRDVLKIFADKQVCIVLSAMLTNPINYSAAYLGKKIGLSVAEIELAFEKLQSIGLVKKTDAVVDDETITVWRVGKTHKSLTCIQCLYQRSW